jgi:SAM-dependent methyltransferase
MHAPADPTAANRTSWNHATALHNRHKAHQGAWLRQGGDTLFDEELGLLGEIGGRDLVHLQCNAGQDSLCLARRGARVTGVDLSDTAIETAQRLSAESGIGARFVRAEVLGWMADTEDRFDLAFASYGALPWVRDLGAWMAGAHRVLRPGGRLVVVEFHPLAWSLGAALDLSGDDYFATDAFIEPVGDYAADALLHDGSAPGVPGDNPHPAVAWQHTVPAIVQAALAAGLSIERLQEWPHSNFCRLSPGLVAVGPRRWGFPPGRARVPLMVGLVARRAP